MGGVLTDTVDGNRPFTLPLLCQWCTIDGWHLGFATQIQSKTGPRIRRRLFDEIDTLESSWQARD